MSKKLSSEILLEYGFIHIKEVEHPFNDFKMPYYVKSNVVLIYNEGCSGNENLFYIGYGDIINGKYVLVPFRWIKYEEELLEIYKAVKGVDLLKNNKNLK